MCADSHLWRRSIRLRIAGFALLLLVCLQTPTARAATAVSGVISNGSWTLGGSPYIIQSSAWTAPGLTLSISPGVVVEGHALSGLIQATSATFSNLSVSGALSLNSCQFYSAEVSIGNGNITGCDLHQGGIVISGAAAVSACTVQGAATGINIAGTATNTTVNGCLVSGCSSRGISTALDVPVTNCQLNDNAIGLYLTGVTPDLQGTTFSGNTNYDVQVGYGNGSYRGDLYLSRGAGVRRVLFYEYGTYPDFLWENGTFTLEGPMDDGAKQS